MTYQPPKGNVRFAYGRFDAAYFCKVFREEFGVTPGEYRKNKRL